MVYLALLPVPLLLATSFLASIASATALPQQAQPKIDPNLVCEGELIAIEIQGETTPDTPSNCLDSAGHLADSGTKVACGNFKVTRKDDGDLVVAETSRAGGGKNYCKLVSNIITCGETSEPQVSHLQWSTNGLLISNGLLDNLTRNPAFALDKWSSYEAAEDGSHQLILDSRGKYQIKCLPRRKRVGAKKQQAMVGKGKTSKY